VALDADRQIRKLRQDCIAAVLAECLLWNVLAILIRSVRRPAKN
jgi:hypothetical protein